MKTLFFVLIFLSLESRGQQLVYTVAGSDTATGITLGDGGPATDAGMAETEGIWMDCNDNLYISDMGDSRIRKVDATTGIITSIAGKLVSGMYGGFSGDGGPATNAQIKGPYGLYADAPGNVYFADLSNNRVRRIDAVTGVINTIAGGGAIVVDGTPATDAQLINPAYVYGDEAGNIYIAESTRIRKVIASSGLITTIAGTSVAGYSGDNGPATHAQLFNPATMIFDRHNNLYVAERGNAVVRKINMTTGIITTAVGTTPGYSGDGGQATNAQISNLNSITIDSFGNLIIGDLQNNVIRKVDAITGIITTIAGDTALSATTAEGAPATATNMHPEFIYLDKKGNLFYSNYGLVIRKIINFNPAPATWYNTCAYSDAVPQIPVSGSKVELYPNPASEEISIKAPPGLPQGEEIGHVEIVNMVGQILYKQSYSNASNAEIDVSGFPGGVYFVKVNGVYSGKFVKGNVN